MGSILKFIFGGEVSDTIKLAETLAAFFSVITDGKLWRSLGWLFLGIMLMLLGVALWIGPSARMSPAGIAARELG